MDEMQNDNENIIDIVKRYCAIGIRWSFVIVIAIVLIDIIGDNIDLKWQSPLTIERRKTNFVTPLKQETHDTEETAPEQLGNEEADATPISSGGSYRMWAGEACWYGTGDGECIGCKAYFDDNGVYYLMRNQERLDDSRKTIALGEQLLIDNSDVVKIGDWVVVENTNNGLREEVQVTDSGQFDTQEGRVADLSVALRDAIQCTNCMVTVETY